EARQILAPERIRCEKTVEMASGNAAIPGDRAIAALAQAQHRPREARAGHAADMHLKTLHRRTAGDLAAADLREDLGPRQHGLDRELSQARCVAGQPFDALGIGNARAQHLEAAAEAEHMPALAAMRRNVDV